MDATADERAAIAETFGDEGIVARVARLVDWTTTPLGPVRGWSVLLRGLTRWMVASRHPMTIYWGAAATMLVNDAALHTVAARVRDPRDILGRSVYTALPEARDFARSVFSRVLAGESVQEREVHLPLARDGKLEDAWFDLEYTPIRELDGSVVATFLVGRERTEEVLALRRRDMLTHLADAVRPLADPVEVEETATRILGTYLGATRVMYGEVESDGEHIRFERSYVEDGAISLHGRFRMRDFGERLVEALTAGRTIVFEDLASSREISPEERAAYAQLGIAALAGVPLVKDGRLVANVSIHSARPRRWSPEDVALIEETAERTWAAVERARAETALRDREEKYRSLFDEMVEGYCLAELVRDAEGRPIDIRFVERNRAFERGPFGEKAVGGALDACVRAVENRESVWFEAHVATSGRWFDVHVHPRGGDRVALLCDDVTVRKEAERVLRISDDRNRFLLALADRLRPLSDSFAVQRAATDLLVEHFAAARSYYSEYEGDLASVKVESVRGDAPTARGVYRLAEFSEQVAALRKGTPLVVHDWTKMRVGPDASAELAKRAMRAQITFPLVKEGRLVAALSVNDDRPRRWTNDDVELVERTAERTWAAVERSRIEAALRESEQLARRLLDEATVARAEAEAANRAKDEFLATIGHELRTPLAAILLWTRAVRSTTLAPRDLAGAFDAIAQSADMQARLIDDLLDLSRLTSGRLALARAAVDARSVVSEAVETVRPLAVAKGVSLTADVVEDVGRAVLDAMRVKQVLWNLLANAVKFTPRDGDVTLRAARTEGHLEVVVVDSGEGIAPEFLPHVFEKFRQADMGERRQHAGLGIGLALAKQLVELHGGTIEGASEGLGRGATFRVRIPWLEPSSSEDARGARAGAEPPSSLAGVGILLVEDDAHTRRAMQWTLEAAGARVIAFEDAMAALAALERGVEIDVIVSDLRLPQMSGLELIEAIVASYAQRGRRPPPSCAVSAHAREIDRRNAIDAGFDMYLAKPITPERLVEAVTDLRAILD